MFKRNEFGHIGARFPFDTRLKHRYTYKLSDEFVDQNCFREQHFVSLRKFVCLRYNLHRHIGQS